MRALVVVTLLVACIITTRGHAQGQSKSCSSGDAIQQGEVVGSGSINTFATSDATACCEACESEDSCLAWTWEDSSDSTNPSTCFLKSDKFYRTLKASATSGVMASRASPYGNGSIPRACATEATAGFPFCDPNLSTQARVNDIIARLTLDEKAALLTARESPDGAVPRLGLPEYDWGANCVHGVQARCALPDENGIVRCPTSFPNPIGLGASFNATLWRGMGVVIGTELRALWVQGVGENQVDNLPHLGLDCWSPNINIARDPRWGRVLETTGEDPVLTGRFAVEYSLGLQRGGGVAASNNSGCGGDSGSGNEGGISDGGVGGGGDNDDNKGSGGGDSGYLVGVTTLKHFAAYSLESYGGVTRHTYDAGVTPYDLATTYLPAWRMAIADGEARGVMCSYNEVNGVPACGSDFLLKTVLRGPVERGGLGFDGYVTSDTGAVEDIYKPTAHSYVASGPEGVALALGATCDVVSSSTG